MNNFLVEETPGKVVGLLGATLFSLAFLFAVTASDASFMGTKTHVADPFSPAKVMAVLDGVSNSYSNFLDTNLFQPSKNDFAMVSDNVTWLAMNASDGMKNSLGVQDPVVPQVMPVAGRVAGASVTRAQETSGPFHMLDNIYTLLTQ